MDDKESIVFYENNNIDIVSMIFEIGEIYDFYITNNFDECVNFIEKYHPKVILLNIDLNEEKIISLIKAIKSNPFFNKISIIIVSENLKNEEKLLKLGVNEFITKPYKSYLVKLRIDTQMKMINYIEKIENLSLTDNLTQLPNRRHFDIIFDNMYENALRNNGKISIIICDIDKFKNFNDTYGHQTGDIVLMELGNVMRETFKRKTDFICRWGGEEFVILMELNNKEALYMAETFRKNVEKHTVKSLQNDTLHVTISLGLCTCIPNKSITKDNLVKKADEMLYLAKNSGRNKVCSTIL